METLQNLFQIGIGLAENFISKAKSISASDEEEMNYKRVMLFFFGKAYKSYQAMKILAQEGFREDALVISRTIFELSLQAQYLNEDPKTLARLFVEHDPVVRYSWYKRLKQMGLTDLVNDIESRQQELQELKQAHDNLSSNYPKPDKWWGKSIWWLADHLGDQMRKRYATVYWELSNYVHTGITSAKEYIDMKDGKFKLNCYPSKLEKNKIFFEATIYFMNIIRQVAEALKVDLEAEYQEAFPKYSALLEEDKRKS